MNIVLLANAASIHTIQWVTYMTKAGVKVSVIFQDEKGQEFPDDIPVYLTPYKGNLGYFLNVFFVKKILKNIKPDLIHAHYASGYGTLAKLVDYHPYILSVWGSDIYDFPYKSKLHHWLVQKNLYAADKLSSTSHCMMAQTLKIAPKLSPFDVVSFGVDIHKFIAVEKSNKNEIVIDTVKILSGKYGIDLSIKSFSILKKKLSISHAEIASKLRLRIVGGGELKPILKRLSCKLDIDDVTAFVGKVFHVQAPSELNKLDIYVALSRLDSESFGVAIIEAGAVKIPTVVSNVGGLPEVVQDQKTGFVVPKENPEAAAEVLEFLVLNEQERLKIGENAQIFVNENFTWESCVEKMLIFYRELLEF